MALLLQHLVPALNITVISSQNNFKLDRHKLRMEQEDMSFIHYGLQNHQGRVESINDHVRPDMTPSLSHSADRQENRSYWIRDRHAFYDRSAKNDEIMAAEQEDKAINLTAEIKPVTRDASSSRSGSPVTSHDDKEQSSQGLTSSQVNAKYSTAHTISGASKRKQRTSVAGTSSPETLNPLVNGTPSMLTMAAAAQNSISPQQLQQMLVAQQQNMLQPQLQQMVQAQQTALLQQKVQEQALAQLNEQLQFNLLQQTQLAGERKANGKQSQAQLQQLALHQHQLLQHIQQLQIPQRQQQFLLACLMQPYQSQQGIVSPEQMHQIWKEAAGASGEDSFKGVPNGLSGLLNGTSLAGTSPLLQGALLSMNGLNSDGFPFAGPLLGQIPLNVKQEDGFNPLYRHGLCKWPGCDAECSDLVAFTKHLNTEHNLDDKNTAQARVQMQIVSQLEIQLNREKELLHAMMQHLHLRPQHDKRDDRETERKVSEKSRSSPKPPPVKPDPHTVPVSPPKVVKPPSAIPHLNPRPHGLPPLIIPPPQPPSMTSVTSHPSQNQSSSQPPTPTGLGVMRRRVSDKCNLPISAEIQRNREFYKNTDVRPPFTYASLIRQAIIESENKQLTLNEVYQWFQNTFAYFRRNEATWKNAVRHNLSLHKCFMRVENVKGAVWTVDEIEFYKRRPQKLTGALSSPSYSADNSPYRDCLDASLRVAIEQNHIFMNQHLSNGSLSDSGAEDLSIRSHGNSNDSFSKPESPQREVPVFPMKHEPLSYQDNINNLKDYTSQGLDLSPRNSDHSPRSSYHSPKVSHTSPVVSSSPPSSFPFSREVGDNMDLKIYKNNQDSPFLNQGRFVDKISELNRDGDEDEEDMQISAHDFTKDQSEALNMKMAPKAEEKEMEVETDSLGEEFRNLQQEILQLSGVQKEAQERISPQSFKPDNPVRDSSRSFRESPVEQVLTNHELYSPLLQSNKVAVVTHSMS